jgi:hypothetical protein
MAGLDELVVDGVTSCGVARGDAELPINRTQVCISSAGTDDKFFGYLGIRQAERHQAQDLDLAGSQTEGVRPGPACLGYGWGSEHCARLLRCCELISHLDRYCYRLRKLHCSPFCPCLRESGLLQISAHRSHYVFMVDALGWWQGSSHCVPQGLCGSIQVRGTPRLTSDSGDACQSLHGRGDSFLLPRLLS